MTVHEERKLAAIMFTDIVGYTALSQANEVGTMKLLEEHRSLLRPIFSRRGGREVKTIGDAFLVEFGSSLEAVRCALEIQAVMSANYAQSMIGRLRVRIGIHVGEVIHAGNDVYGDAVNIAARIEPLAEPGGICVSRQVYEFVHGRVDAQLAKVGPVELKNVKALIEVYKVLPPEKVGDRMTAGLLKKRVAVIPFDNFSPEPGDEYFADGLTEEMIGTLSKIRELSVISRTSVMQYKRRPKAVSEIGMELNAGTILEGSVRKSGNRARVSVQMIDATQDRHLWAETYDRDLQDIFAVQSDIAGKVADALKVELLASEKESIRETPTNSPEANLLYLKGIHQGDKGSPSDILKAIEYFELAVEQDPEFALAYALASVYYIGAAGEALPPGKAFPKARESIERALEINPRLAIAQAAKGWLAFQNDWDWKAAEDGLKKAVSTNPSLAEAHDWYGMTLASQGRFEEAIFEMESAFELDPASIWVMARFTLVHWMAGRNVEAREMLNKVLKIDPKFARAHSYLSFIALANGRKDEAIREADAAVEIADETLFHGWQAAVHASAGSVEKAREILANLLAGRYKGYATKFWIGAVYYLLNERDQGYKWMKQAYEERDPGLPFYNGWPLLRPLREDPRFMEILGELKLP